MHLLSHLPGNTILDRCLWPTASHHSGLVSNVLFSTAALLTVQPSALSHPCVKSCTAFLTPILVFVYFSFTVCLLSGLHTSGEQNAHLSYHGHCLRAWLVAGARQTFADVHVSEFPSQTCEERQWLVITPTKTPTNQPRARYAHFFKKSTEEMIVRMRTRRTLARSGRKAPTP